VPRDHDTGVVQRETFIERETLPAYQELATALMLPGWYPTGEGPPDSLGHTLSGFRRGHRTDSEPEKTLRVPGACELEAMHALLAQLRQAEADLAAPEGAHHPPGYFDVSLTDERMQRLTAQRLLADRGSSPVRRCLTTHGRFVAMPRTSAVREPAALEAARDVRPRVSQLVTIHVRSTLVTREPVSGGG
jgi:hypothetical protein